MKNHTITESQIAVNIFFASILFFWLLYRSNSIVLSISITISLLIASLLVMQYRAKAMESKYYLNRKRNIYVIGQHPKTNKEPYSPRLQKLLLDCEEDIVVVKHKEVERKKAEIKQKLQEAENKNDVQIHVLFFQQPVDDLAGVEQWEQVEGERSYPDRLVSFILDDMGKKKRKMYETKEEKYKTLEAGIYAAWDVETY